jgi:hypothetical protein
MAITARGMRVSDEDRRVAGERLRVAVDEGRLTPGDYDQRLGRAYAAVTAADLDELFTDLPAYPYAPRFGGYPQAYPAAYPVRSSGLATAGLVLGILGLVGFWVPFVSLLLSGLAVVVSGLGLAQTAGNAQLGRGKATAGLVCGLLGLIPAVVVIILFITAVAVL